MPCPIEYSRYIGLIVFSFICWMIVFLFHKEEKEEAQEEKKKKEVVSLPRKSVRLENKKLK